MRMAAALGVSTDYLFSIAGAAKQPAIDRLKNSKLELTLAVDNDDAGQKWNPSRLQFGTTPWKGST